MKLTSLRIINKDIKQSVQFYEKVMGLTVQWYTEDFAELSTNTITIAIRSTRTMQLFGESLTDQIVQEPTIMSWGNRSLLFPDPDGNLINFFTPVSEQAIQKFS